MSTKPFLSICIPAYNAQDTVEGCLGSIAEQSFDDYEVVVVDDGSMEPLVLGDDQLSGLDSSRVKLIRQENKGTYAARQKAIGEACGRYVFCMVRC